MKARVLIVDDEPLVLIEMQSIIDWDKLGFELIGTARNGGEALQIIQDSKPDIVISDIMMPVLNGLDLIEKCREQDPYLPVFIMLTSFEEFEYVKRSISLNAVDYLVKMELQPENLTAALERATDFLQREYASRNATPLQSTNGLSIENYKERFFIQLYSGFYKNENEILAAAQPLEISLKAPSYIVAIADIRLRELSSDALVKLSTGITRMAADTIPKYLPCYIAGINLQHFFVLFPLEGVLEKPDTRETVIADVLEKVNTILYNYFSIKLWWAVSPSANSLNEICQSYRNALASLSLLSEENPLVFYRTQPKTNLDHQTKIVASVQDYIRENFQKKLSLNDVATVFNFSPNYLSQLFSENGETGFVEFVTNTRIAAAKELMVTTNLKIYEISEQLGFESAFYFSKVFKKSEGISPRNYMQKLHTTETGDSK